MGRHLIVEIRNANDKRLDDMDFVRSFLLECVDMIDATFVNEVWVKFEPQGLSGTVVISESHLFIHTYPEHKYASFDVYTCNTNINLEKLVPFIKEKFEAKEVEYFILTRTK
ncbi:MAG: adenosylmethionine decarboxylase [Candidatus Micrarchaeota archaeon]|nr:adenosylmethionine decarboxylase [Candidatus Micrarchaeota archaeon]